MRTLIEHANERGQPLHMASIDSRSAFDSVDLNKTFGVLVAMGFPNDLLAAMHSVYAGARTRVCVGETHAPEIPILRGTIQGDPLSPVMFSLAVRPLLTWLRAGNDAYIILSEDGVACVKIPSMAMADDLNILSGSQPAQQRQLCNVDAFACWSGMDVNCVKCFSASTAAGDPPRVTLGGRVLKALDRDKEFKVLGVYFTISGAWHHQYEETLAYAKAYVKRLEASGWDSDMKVSAIRYSLTRRILFKLAVVPVRQEWCTALQSVLLTAVKHALGIAKTMANAAVILPRKVNGMGLTGLNVHFAEASEQALT